MIGNWSRRDWLRHASLGAAVPALKQASGNPPPERAIRVGFIGVGSRGTSLLRTALGLPGIEVPALCDINETNLSRAQQIVEKSGRPRPEGYSSGVEDFRRLVARNDLDAVINAAPWQWHTPMSVATMKAGKYSGVEVPAAITVEECWELVNTSEATGKPCMILENVCYFRNVLMVLNLIRQGLLGEMTHCEGGYQHDVRSAFIQGERGGTPGEITWRGMHAATKNGNLYPTHAIGPMAWWLDVNRGDRFTYLTSMSSKSVGINEYVARRHGPNHPNAKRTFALGDVNTTLIRTERGATVTLYLDMSSPRPYDLILRAQGTKGIYSGTLDKVYLDGMSPKADEWEDAKPYYERYDHPLWKKLGTAAQDSGHGGADYITLHQFFQAVRAGTQTPIDVYDTAVWSVMFPLSIQSVAAKSNPVDVPDFTRGKWKERKPLPITE